jgi:hypothetical protein
MDKFILGPIDALQIPRIDSSIALKG